MERSFPKRKGTDARLVGSQSFRHNSPQYEGEYAYIQRTESSHQACAEARLSILPSGVKESLPAPHETMPVRLPEAQEDETA